MRTLYKRFAKYYDLIYSKKDYGKEVRFIIGQIKKNKIKGKEILDVACGTGNHDLLLKKKSFSIIGVDLNKEMLAIARKKVKGAKYIQRDMRTFNLKKKFDVVLCLFSAMHYNLNYRQLEKTIRNFCRHLKPSGLLIFDMGFNEERWRKGVVDVGHFQGKDVHVLRFSTSRRQGKDGTLDMGYIVYKNHKFGFAQERHTIRIFETLKVKKIMKNAGFETKTYQAYTNKFWTKRSKVSVVFVGKKR